MYKTLLISAAVAALTVGGAGAVPLSNGVGDGSVNVSVDGFGSFGDAVGGDTSDAVYDPVGEVEAAGTTFESAIAVSFGGVRPYLTTGDISGPDNPSNDLMIVSSDDTSVTSTFSVGVLDFQLEQTLVSSFNSEGVRVGSALNQVYTITNTAEVANSFDIVRYLDGDLDFDGSIDDGGGRIFQSGNEILFETDAASENDESTTFVGITANGGEPIETNRFEISEFSSLQDRIPEGGQLGDFVQRFPDIIIPVDGELEGPIITDGVPVAALNEAVFAEDVPESEFIEVAYDVTLALRNEFALEAGETTTYSTTTLFGNAVPPAPGSLEALPLLPEEIDENGAFVFIIGPGDFDIGETFFIDPVIAVGYTYEVTGATFDSVTAPTLAAVNDADGYLLEYLRSDGMAISVMIAPGEEVSFTDGGFDGVSLFTLTGIDPALMLDPTDDVAFVTGVSFASLSAAGAPAVITQTPITIDTTPTGVIPLPPSAFLLGFAVLALGAMRRRAA